MSSITKILPITKPPVVGRLYYSLIPLLNHKDAWNWINNDFVSLQFYNHRNDQSDSLDFATPSPPLVENIHIRNIDPNTFIKNIIEYIDNDYYATVNFDDYYIPQRGSYKKTHYTHVNFIYGYDIISQQFKTIGYTDKREYAESNLPFSCAFDGYKFSTAPEVTLYKTIYNDHYDFNLESLTNNIVNFISPVSTKVLKHPGQNAKELFMDIDAQNNVINYLRDLVNGQVPSDIRNLHILWEQKKLLHIKMKYLYEHQLIDESFVNKYAYYANELSILRNLFLKYMVCNEKRIIYKIINKLENITSKEIRLLTELAMKLLSLIDLKNKESNLVWQSYFESGNAGWTLYSGAHVSKNDSYSGISSLCINADGCRGWSAVYQKIHVVPNTNYTLRFYAKGLNEVLYISPLDICYKSIEEEWKSIKANISEWTLNEMTFNSWDNNEIFLYINTEKTGTVYLDNFELLISNKDENKNKNKSNNLLECAKIDMVLNEIEDYVFKHHQKYIISWGKQVNIRYIHFYENCKVIINLDEQRTRSEYIIMNHMNMPRTIDIHRKVLNIKLDIFSNEIINFSNSTIKVEEDNNLLRTMPASASSVWSYEIIDGCKPENALSDNEFESWTTKEHFIDPEFLEVDLGQPTLVNRVVVKERKAVQRIREYYIEGFNEYGNSEILTRHSGCMYDQAVEHAFSDKMVSRLRITITKAVSDSQGYNEPSLCRFEAYYDANHPHPLGTHINQLSK